ncbi:YhdP family protein [Geoalkalibacter halelectricus]|uniref:AsmA-like C-terminal domain-containing protein n=1 Tax=Geoalkalibacter halelectricus TaxID=2847045 RepID=A0ABY5ZSR8_9BACT|nr:AsmA-like C-terminal domain-containing protein [Geoalkalibacter halelectricus]MDO3379191.1 AsmA-like C-terminal domain-containing protein [Geoalkalibacter halelectricus]UWZ80950.1 AsmA-like C-terminal domain-containing protein [Geoalkalibacter halelectricus]
MIRRHPIIALVCLLLLTAGLALALFVYTFDLNRYRERLEQELSRALDHPVSISDARLTLHRGVALDFREVRIGATGTDLHATAEHLYLHLEFRPLLQRRISISTAELTRPNIDLSFVPSGEDQQEAILWPAGFELNNLRVRDGRLTWRDGAEAGPKTVQNLNAEIKHLAAASNLSFALSAEIVQEVHPAKLNLSGHLTPAQDLRDWPHWQVEAQARITDLAGQELPLHLRELDAQTDLSGFADLDLLLRGQAAAGLHLEARLAGSDLEIFRAGRILPLSALEAQAAWQVKEGDWWLIVHQAKLNHWALEGPVGIAGGHQPLRLRGHLSASSMDVREFLPWLYAFRPDLAPSIEKFKPVGGSLHLRYLSFAHEPAPEGSDQGQARGSVQELDLKISDMRLDPPQGPIREANLHLTLAQERLEVVAGRLTWQEVPLTISGFVSSPFQPDEQLSLKMDSRFTADKLTGLIPTLPADFSAAGPLHVQVALSGRRDQPDLAVDADLSETRLNIGEHLEKKTGRPARLNAACRWQAPNLVIDQALIQLGPITLDLKGRMETDPARSFALTARLHETDLAALRELAPSLERAQLGGKLAGTLELAASAGEITRRTGEFDLQGGSASLAGIVGDLNQARGRILLSGTEVRIPEMQARLGESNLQLHARIADLNDPQIEIHLEGRDLRPQDLIFPGEEGRLESVAGRMLIDRRQVVFDALSARTQGGTRALVTGAVSSFSPPKVELNIAAEYGNVDEILAFFRHPPEESEAQAEQPETEGRMRVRIEVRADRGRFHNLDFVDGQAVIHYHNRVLDIYPLRASLDPGYYVGRVVWAGRRAQSPPLLVVSGSVLEADAEALYRSQTQLRGLVSGKLRGAFYMEGEGDNFWPSARGGLNFEVREGTLYRFPVLSKIFSLLNVSQIFTFRLPDMSREGMPFNKLSADVLLRDGRLSTESLFIDSHAMNLSLVGEVDLGADTIDAVLGVKPLRTVDKIVTRIPIAGWLLAGEEQALVTAHFKIQGPRSEPNVVAVPITSLSEKVFGIFRRVLGLPGKMISDFERALTLEEDAGAQEP